MISCWTDSWAKAFLYDVQKLFPGVSIQGKGLLATEGIISIPLQDCSYPVLASNSHFFEFRSLKRNKIYLSHEIEKGELYEVIITTGGGLYRYNLHDIVKIRGFFGESPMFEFIGKTDKVSDLTGEKLNESHVQGILESLKEKFFQKDGIIFLAGTKKDNSFAYNLYVDSSILNPETNSQELLNELEKQLAENFHYLHSRQMKQLSTPRLVILDKEQIQKYLDKKSVLRSTSKFSCLVTDISELQM